MTKRNVILSSPIIIGEGTFQAVEIDQADAEAWVNTSEPQNYCGHETVRILGLEPDRGRKSCTGYDSALCISAKKRLEFGREYTGEEIEEIGVEFKMISRVE